ncbi:MAG: hypothetical protein NZZ60_02280 [Bacteroidia bacterium]|nr:hypothetical protein [Bacteroidia bacterium]MCX7652418.1 hypothetical protein [Bacteroidia bacterium]MDW8417349.1 hypothetical protein [Bacteroidia bacterium]
MNYEEKLAILSDHYQRERRKLVPSQAMEVLIQAFPAVLVAQADGFTDTSEVQRLSEIVAFLCRRKEIPMNTLDWTAEIRYLSIDADFWRKTFLDTLKAFLQLHPQLYNQQAEFMYAVAVASTGDVVRNLLMRFHRQDSATPKEELEVISDKERAEIERLAEELEFQKVPEALSYLRSLLAHSHA